MARTPLSMKPTGWFQVAWSSEVAVGAVRTMHYFGREMVAWRSRSGQVSVFDAYCEHLGAHLGHGGHVEGENLVCPFHGWEWNREGRNVCIPYEKHPNRGRRIRSYPVVERNEAVWIWHDVDGRAPYFDVPDIFADFDDGKTAADYYPPVPAATLFEPGLEIHPQYIMENGVDFAHFKFVHKTPFMPEFTRHDFAGPVSHVDFTIAFDEGATLENATSGVESINAGLGCSVTKSWGMVDNRTMPAVTPVDDHTSDVRFTVWIGRKPGEETGEITRYGKTLADLVIEQFAADIEIWAHQRYSDPPALSRREFEGFTALREWARQFYPDGGASGDDFVRIRRSELDALRAAAQSWPSKGPLPVPLSPPSTSSPIRVFQVATGNLGTEMIARIQAHPDLELVGLHCYTPDKVGRDAGEIVGIDPVGVTATGSVDDIIAADPDVLTFHGVFPDEDLYLQVLEAGIDIVTTADWITGFHRDTNHPHHSGRKVSELIAEACERGGATFYGTGMNPGLAQILGIVHTADVADIENITVTESVDVSCHHSVDTWKAVGYGLPVDDPSIPDSLYTYTAVFADSVYLMADAFDLELDEVTFSYELGACTKDVDLGWYRLPAGSLGGSYIKYQGMVDGVARVESHLEWQMTPHTDPSWNIQACYITQVTGDPNIYSKHMIFPRKGFDLSKPENFASIGMTVTGLPALNSIKSVVAAPPGIVTSADLPLRTFAGRFKL